MFELSWRRHWQMWFLLSHISSDWRVVLGTDTVHTTYFVVSFSALAVFYLCSIALLLLSLARSLGFTWATLHIHVSPAQVSHLLFSPCPSLPASVHYLVCFEQSCMITAGSAGSLPLKSTLPNRVQLPLQLLTTIGQDPGSSPGSCELSSPVSTERTCLC